MCNSSDVRLRCPLFAHPIRPQRCTEVLLERFGVFPSTHLPAISARLGLTPVEIDVVCSACPLNPVEEPIQPAVRVVNEAPPAAGGRRRLRYGSDANAGEGSPTSQPASSYLAGFRRAGRATGTRR
jgi:hypothetical protein